MEFKVRQIDLPSPGAFEPPLLAIEHLAWLKRESARHNLTSVPEKDWLIRHIMDSLVPAFAGWEVGGRFLDLGTGAGFPGIPLAGHFSQAAFTLLEKKKKTTQILNEFLSESGLIQRGKAVAERAESLARDPLHRAGYDCIVARALASIPVLIELGIPFLKTGGELWAWKSDLTEMEKADEAFKELRAKALHAVRYRLPGEENDRYLVAIRKEGETPIEYSRREGIPEKRPL